MLDTMRQNANKWFIKFLLILVMASFVLWGILDMVMKSQSNQSVAQVGSHKISLDSLIHSVDRVMRVLQQRNVKDVNQLVIVDRALKDLINAELVDQELAQHGLVVSDSWLREIVHSMPVFQRGGRFDPELFRNLLAQNHLSDVRFLSDLREQLKTQHYTGAILSGTNLPKVYSQHVMNAVRTPYVFATVTLSTKQMLEPKAPTEEELQLYYTNNTKNYLQPERRVVHMLYVDTNKLAESTPVSKEEVQALFEERTASSLKPTEKRDVQRVTFSTRAAADKAVKQMSENKTLKGLSKGWNNAKYEEQSLEKSQAPEAIADILFTLKQGGNTGVIETPSGYSIYQVVRIHATDAPKLDAEFYQQLENEIRMNRSGDTIKQWLDQLNDELASGQNIHDLAKKYNLKIVTADMQESGQTSDGTWPAGLKPEVCQKVAKEAFSLAIGQTSPLLETDNHTSVVASVEKITPARTPDFKEVASLVKRDWAHSAKQKVIEEKCRDLLKAKNVKDLDKAAAALGAKVAMQKPVSSLQFQEALADNEGNKSNIPAILLEMDGYTLSQVFSIQPGESIVGRLKDDSWVVVMLDRYLQPEGMNSKNLEAGVNAAFERELSALLLLALKKKHPVNVDAEVVKQVIDRMSAK